MKKISTGIATITVITIMTSIFAFVSSLFPSSYNATKDLYVYPLGYFFILSNMLINVFSIIIGFSILKLKKWARKIRVVISIVAILIMTCSVLSIRKDAFVEQKKLARLRIEERIKDYPEERKQRMRAIQEAFEEKGYENSLPIIYGLVFSWNLLIIMFFMNKNVKERFE